MRKLYHTGEKNLIIVPKVVRHETLKLVNNDPITVHFAVERTLNTTRTSMDWPGLVNDVQELCTFCLNCQKVGSAIITKAPLQSLPVMKEPFNRVAWCFRGCFWTLKNNKKWK